MAKIKARIFKTGNSFAIRIPKALIDTGILKERQMIELDFDVIKSTEDKNAVYGMQYRDYNLLGYMNENNYERKAIN